MKPDHSTRTAIIATLIVALAIGACSPLPNPPTPASPTPTPRPVPPTPALEPAEDYAAGTAQIPTGLYLFVAAATFDECSGGKCGCPVVEPPRAVYEWDPAGGLYIDEYYYQEYFLDPANADSSTSLLGIFGYGEWREKVSAIDTLPYNQSGLILYSVAADGVIVADIQGKAYFVRPGESWLVSGTYASYVQADCSLYYETRFTNYGLLKRQQIHPEE